MSLCGTVLFNVSFLYFQIHISLSSSDWLSAVCPQFCRKAKPRVAVFRALATVLFRYLFCYNLSESSSYLCLPCSVLRPLFARLGKTVFSPPGLTVCNSESRGEMKTTSGFINKAKLGAAATAESTRQRKPIKTETAVFKLLVVLN